MKRTLFVSYSHDNIDQDKLNYLLDQIEKKGRSTVRVLIDMKEVRLGGSFADYMALIDSYSVDAVLMILTPTYKTKISRNEGNVPPEFKAIMARYEDDKQSYLGHPHSELSVYNNVRQFGVLPVLFQGIPSESLPDRIREESLRYFNAVDAVVHKDRDGKLIPTTSASKVLGELADLIVVELKNIAKQKDREYQDRRARIRQALFANTKAGANPGLEAEVFARTMTYQRVLNQESYFILGRKGSGKSTLTEQLECQNPSRYASHVRIDFSKIALSFVYSYYTDRQFQSDAQSTRVYRAQYLELVWECFFFICLIWHKKDLQHFDRWLRDEFQDDALEYTPQEFFNAALNNSFERFAEFQKRTIDSSGDTLASLPARLSPRKFVEHAFGKSLVQKITELAKSGTRLITLDGIDSAFHDYRMEYLRFGSHDSPDYYQDRARVELDLIKALMRLVADVKAKPADYPILSACEFCITIPLDLYQEIKWHHERDSYQLLASCRALDWSGFELALMLRKRLEKLNSVQVDKEKYYGPRERLLELLDDCYSGLPQEIPVEVGDRVTSFPIFIYVLRYTFWRPREIIFHFVGLLSSFEYFKGKVPITTRDVKAIVKEQAKALVASEFIDEFKSTITNIEEIIGQFASGPQYYPVDKFVVRLDATPFNFYVNPHASGQSAADIKLRLLYEVGFIGLRLTNEQMIQYSRPRDIFAFCEGMVIFDDIARGGFNGSIICIHPVFVEYLNVEVDQSQEIAWNIDWEYLRENEVRRNAAVQW